MSIVSLALLASSIALLFLVFLFRYEARRGRKFLSGLRAHVDFFLLKIRHFFNVRLLAWGRYFIRQIGHYILHTLLTGAIASLASLEERLRTIARSNRAIAKRSDKERSHINRLEEIALHKMEVALSEEEKRIRRRKSLEG